VAGSSYWACVLSLETLRSLYPERSTFVLWTLTFADPAAQWSTKEASKRFVPVGDWLNKQGYKLVRVLERGARNGRWHYHLVTFDRIPWDVLQERIMRYGFGKVLDYREKTMDSYHYVAKYLGKQFGQKAGDAANRVRRFGCIGFKGTPCSRVQTLNRKLTLVADMDPIRPITLFQVLCDDKLVSLHVRREVLEDEDELIYTMKISSALIQKLQDNALAGVPSLVAEYRVCDVVTKQVSDYKTGVKVDRVIVSHTIETAKGALHLTEWLPPGADPKAVKAPAQKGDVVLIELTAMVVKFGNTTLSGTITKAV